jgi:hypothetical protein
MHMPKHETTKYTIRPNNGTRALESCLKKIEAYSGLEENEPCHHCGIRNPTGYITCFSCHMPIGNTNVELRQNKQHTVNMLNFIAQDYELSRKLLLLIEEASKKQDIIHQGDENRHIQLKC